ncbi:McrC family protein [Bradyrhizobium sp. S3.9.1]|uniref:McrC family protein n=1 Tax=Bradyrhizobium sp. S3.9.1 TaxID=3156431 RepID=UPI003394ECD8
MLNYVGVVETPCGTQIEILPKYTQSGDEIEGARRLLVSMVMEALRLKPRHGAMSEISAFQLPLPEWLASRFLQEASDLIHRGLRQSYQRVQAREPLLRGALDVVRQIRSGPASAHLLSFQHDIFTFDRPENRLLRSAIELILRSTRVSNNWRLARELSTTMADIPETTDLRTDLRRWSKDRLMADYSTIRTLCELILLGRTPFAISGAHRGLSMLLPMERLFELYVLASLRKAAPSSMEIRAQLGDRHLCEHEGDVWFRLRPDMMVSDGARSWILDTKWKLLSSNRARQYELSQSDFYQLFAYGQKYLGGAGDLFLVYPRTETFFEPLAPFHFSPQLRLHVLPFDLLRREAPYPFLPCK